jgi:hypothetical protein
LLARANSGMRTYRLENDNWRQLGGNQPAWADGSGWDDVTNYSTIQAVGLGSTLFLLARANAGMHTYRLNGDNWVQVQTNNPPWSDSAGWNAARYYSTIQAVAAGNRLYLLGRAAEGIELWRLDGNNWRPM